MTKRRLDWAQTRTFVLARMMDAVDAAVSRRTRYHLDREIRDPPRAGEVKLRHLLREGYQRWAEVSAKASHEPLEFAKARLRVLLQVVRKGLDPLPEPRPAISPYNVRWNAEYQRFEEKEPRPEVRTRLVQSRLYD